MSADLKTKKRKSTGEPVKATKKVKVAKSADKPAPAKSALKTSKEETVKAPKAAVKKTKTVKKTPVKQNPNGHTAAIVVDTEDGGTELTPDQTAALLAGFSSSEDEASDAEDDGVALSTIPNAPTTGAVQKAIKEATSSNDPERTPGVIYIGRIPHGFYEQQMRAYFGQFGDITHLKLARNKKTGRSKHYAFVEFASGAVADIVAKTMDKYLLFNHILQVRRVPSEQVKEGMFKGADRRKKVMPRNRIEGGKLRRGMVRDAWEKRVDKENKRRSEKAEKLRELGYEFEMPVVKTVSDVPVQAKAIEEAPAVMDGEHEGGAKLLDSADASTETFDDAADALVEPPASAMGDKAMAKKRAAVDGVKAKKAKKVKKIA